MNMKRSVSLLVLLSVIFLKASAQMYYTTKDFNSDYKKGIALFEKEKYQAAIRLLDAFVKNESAMVTEEKTEAEFYAALASIKVSNPDAEYRMILFATTHPDHPRINQVWFELANYFYQNKNYKRALKYYDLVDRLMLEGSKLPEYFFKNGYSNFMSGDKMRALLMFSEIKDIDTEYTAPAMYYFSHIAYERKKYGTALDGFIKLKDDETFGAVVPFYIVQILYLQKDYDGILGMAPALIASAGKARAIELYRFIGDAWFNKGKYNEAIPYLEKYTEGAKASAREDKYQLGYCYYKSADYNKAVEVFLEIDAKQDILSQNIWYLLGDCYIQKGDKKRAQLAFSNASKMDFDKTIKEESLFHFAKLTYETSYSPFGEVIAAFQNYLDQYPGSERIEEVYNYLVATYMQIKNYKAAMESLDKIGNKDKRLEEAYQRVAFFRGLELFRNLNFEASADMFDKSLKYGQYSLSLRARSLYWRGEAYYRMGSFDEAIANYEEFMGMPGASDLNEYKLIRYNLGYAYFSKKEYDKALNMFKTYESNVADRPDIITDARDRIADCYYVATDYAQAISYYSKVIDYGKTDADYAMFQKGFTLGLMNDQKGKTDNLTAMISKFPASSYIPSAYFERGRAYVVLKDDSKGEADFNTVIKSYQNSPYVPRAIVQLGLLYYNKGENEKAINQYKQAIEKYKSTPEARSALTGLKTTYSELNEVEAYFAYVKTLDGYGDINMAEKDSMLYNSGENLYINGNCEKATEVFRNYLSEFERGSFRLNAQFYLAECLNKTGETDEALKNYLEVVKASNNEFIELSLINIASIYYKKEEYESSLNYYNELEKVSEKPENVLLALSGQLNAAYQAGDAIKTIEAAGKMLKSGRATEESSRKANFLSAKAYYSLDEMDQALNFFKQVATEVTSVEGAESKYRVAELLYKKGMVPESEKIITEFIDQNTPHQFWMARMFLLLADISISKGDNIQARATLQSLLDYYSVDNDGILDETRAKLDSLNKSTNTLNSTVNIKTDSTQIN
jgi:tetratricopeptide (TPR) repeat protein